MSAHHHHHRGHTHNHLPKGEGAQRRLLIAGGISLIIVFAQGMGAYLSGSLALAADTGHVAVDSVGLAVAALAAILIRRPASRSLSYGMIRVEGIAATLQALMILIICLVIGYEGIERLWSAETIDGLSMSAWAVVGLIGNLSAMLVLSGRREDNLNIKAAFLEVLVDTLSSVAVIVGGILVAVTGLEIIDSGISLLIAVAMLPRAWSLLRQSLAMLFDSVPAGLSLAEVQGHIEEIVGVLAVHDLHIWQPRTGLVLVTAHVVVRDEELLQGKMDRILAQLHECMREHFSVPIEHATFQLESQSHSQHERIYH